MPDKWDKYLVETTTKDKWDSYLVGEEKPIKSEFSYGKMFANAPESLLRNIVEPVTNLMFKPGETVANLAEAVTHPSRTWEAIKKPYTSWDEFKSTIQEDPFRPLVDLSMAAGGTGAALRGAGAISKVGWLGKAGKVASEVGAISDPIWLGEKLAGIPLKFLPESVGENLYRGVLKPKKMKGLPPEQVESSIKWARENGILINERGLKLVREKIDEYNSVFDRISLEAKRSGDVIRSNDVLGYVKSTEDLFSSIPGGEQWINQIEGIKNDFLNRISKQEKTTITQGRTVPIGGPSSDIYTKLPYKSETPGPTIFYMPVDEAIKTKQRIYNVLEKAYGDLSTATKETQKAIARGIKEEIIILKQQEYPQLREIGLKERDAIKLEHMISDRLNVTTRKDLLSLGEIIGGVGGTAIGGPTVGGVSAIAVRLSKNPSIMSWLSNKLHYLEKNGFKPLRTYAESPYWLGTRQKTEALGRIQQGLTPQMTE